MLSKLDKSTRIKKINNVLIFFYVGQQIKFEINFLALVMPVAKRF